MKQKLCITYISTGKYKLFFTDFIKSFYLNFCIDCDRTFYIFTDDVSYINDVISKNNITDVNVECFPIKDCGNSDFLKFRKFKILNEVESYYSKFDYIFYFNGNLICRIPVTLDDMFAGKEQYAVTHSAFNRILNPLTDSLCKESKSAAYFEYKLYPNYHYCQSGNIGATYNNWIKMIDFIESCRYFDKYYGYDKFVPWHDETYYNKYINILYHKNPQSVNILDGKMYLCSHDSRLSEYAKRCKMILLWKEYFWSTGKSLSDITSK